jgi:hypothetical protein
MRLMHVHRPGLSEMQLLIPCLHGINAHLFGTRLPAEDETLFIHASLTAVPAVLPLDPMMVAI